MTEGARQMGQHDESVVVSDNAGALAVPRPSAGSVSADVTAHDRKPREPGRHATASSEVFGQFVAACADERDASQKAYRPAE